MTSWGKAFLSLVLAGATGSLVSTLHTPGTQWVHFTIYLVAILLSSGMKVAMPKSEGTMSVNYPLILLGILQLSPFQAVILAIASVLAQCRFGVVKQFTFVQVLFNLANVTTATVLAWHTYASSLRFLQGETAPALACAATIYFLTNTIPVSLIIGLESGTAPQKQWRTEFLWYFPFYLVGAMLAAAANFIGMRFGWMTSMLLIPMVYTVYRAYKAQIAIVKDRERHIQETEALHLRSIEGLAMAIEAKDENTHRHLMRVRVYTAELGKLMGLDTPTMQALLTASLLHDIGKLAVPEYIISKPGKLTPEEFDKMKTHPAIGADIIERIHFPYPAAPIVRSHHESWDGSGYPDGLKGKEIPVGARILSTVDCFDALASDRPYRKALPLEQAMDYVKSRAGISFDPEVVQLLAEHYPRLEELARSQLNEMEPLKTDLMIAHGGAPAAGFAEDGSRESGDESSAGNMQRLFIAQAAANEILAMSAMPGASLGVGQIGKAVCGKLQSLIPFDCFALSIRDQDFLLPRWIEGTGAAAFNDDRIRLGEGLSGWVALSHRSILNGNPTVETNYQARSSFYASSSSALSVPLFDSSGALNAVLTVYARNSAAFSHEDLQLLESIQADLGAALENAQARNEEKSPLAGKNVATLSLSAQPASPAADPAVESLRTA